MLQKHGDVQLSEEAEPDELCDVREVDVRVLNLAGVDALAAGRVGLVGSLISMPSTLASTPSSSGAVEAPVQMPTRKCSPRAFAASMRLAMAAGTTLG